MPTGLPITRPTMMPSVTLESAASPRAPPPMATPTLANAKIGTITKLVHG